MSVLCEKIVSKWGADKVLHFLGGLGVCALTALVLLLQDGAQGWEAAAYVVAGAVVAVVMAGLKELVDGVWDWRDIAATAAGCVPVALAVVLGAWFFSCSS